jgi:hypothetical protein
VNSATLESLEKRLAVLDPAAFDGARIAAEHARIAAVVAAEALTPGNRSEALTRAAERLQMPLGVVEYVDRAGTHAQVSEPAPEARAPARRPDWSWHTAAVEQSLKALGKGTRYKAALVVPTGGGKTRIALQVALRWLAPRHDGDELVLWVTHRRHLRTHARRTLQKLLVDPAHLHEGVELFSERIRFAMVQDLSAIAAELAAKIGLVIVDEAHHAAAPSYSPIFDEFTCPALFLTATPNRADERSIGIDEICYTITYRELFDRGCLVEPTFEPSLDMPHLDWSRPEGVLDLADYLLDRADGDFTKSLVVVGQQHRPRFYTRRYRTCSRRDPCTCSRRKILASYMASERVGLGRLRTSSMSSPPGRAGLLWRQASSLAKASTTPLSMPLSSPILPRASAT